MLNTDLFYLPLKHPGSVICWKLLKKTVWALVQQLICGSCLIMSICFTHINSIHLLSVFLSAGFVILRTGGQFVCRCVNPLNDNSEGALILMVENWKLAQKFIHFFSCIIGVLFPTKDILHHINRRFLMWGERWDFEINSIDKGWKGIFMAKWTKH